VYKRGFVFGARDEMMLNVDSDKLTIIPYTMSGGALRREAKLVSYQMENIMEVSDGPESLRCPCLVCSFRTAHMRLCLPRLLIAPCQFVRSAAFCQVMSGQ
jgi:hypothetical protein